MFTPLAKLAIGLSATMATAFYYLAAAPPASAQNVCGAGNYSSTCSTNTRASSRTQPPRVITNPVPVVPIVQSPSPAPIAAPVPVVPIVESPSPAPIADPVPVVPVVESPAPIADPVPPPEVAQPDYWQNIYSTPTPVRPPTAIPEPGTVVALLVTGAGILCSGRKRNKQVRQQR